MRTDLAHRPDTLPAEQLAQWAHVAKDALAPNTTRAYRSDSAHFATWCAEQGLASLPAAPEAIVAYARAQAASSRAIATIRRRLSTIARMHRAAGLEDPCTHELVRLTLKGLARELGTDQRQAAALSADDARRIELRLTDSNTLKDARDLALVLVGRDLLARGSELLSIVVTDVMFEGEGGAAGALIRLRRAKTSTETSVCFIGPRAARALSQWISRAQIVEGPIFQRLARGGRPLGRAISVRALSDILKMAGRRAGLEHADDLSTHSARVGMAQDLTEAGFELPAIQQAGGWRSPTMPARYSEKLIAKRGAVARFYQR